MPDIQKNSATPFQQIFRIYYEDTDAGGIVYHSNYLKYLERTRTEWLRSHGYDQRKLSQEEGILFAVSRMSIQFHAPAQMDDQIQVTATIKKISGARLIFDQAIFLYQTPQQKLISAEVVVATVNLQRRPVRIPKTMLDRFQS
ncbi:tol-pal system-associated acyl-CoA thioesterase [Magnetococcales bacterium HHB-1]